MEQVGNQLPQSVSDILERWPGIAEYDIEQATEYVRYCHQNDTNTIADELFDMDSNDSKIELLRNLTREMTWRVDSDSEITDDEYSKIAASTLFRHEECELKDAIRDGNTELADSLILAFLNRWPITLRVGYEESALFPNGRRIYIPIDLTSGQEIETPRGSEYLADCCGDEHEVDKEIVKYATRPKSNEGVGKMLALVGEAVEKSTVLDKDYYDQLRLTYGTKAANLFVLDEAISKYKTATRDAELYYLTEPIVPSFTVAPVALFKLYRDGDSRYSDYLEKIRQQAIAVCDESYDPELFKPLVAVRSSAVFSEDGENASGAGIYDSLAVDPRDAEAFRAAVEAVFASVDSDKAKTYRAAKDIEEELMGLVIQQYAEAFMTSGSGQNSTFGFIRSIDGSGNLIELSCSLGELQYDRAKVLSKLMFNHSVRREMLVVDSLHTVPDHDTNIAEFSQQGSEAAHTALFAERLFGKHVELEFVFDGHVKIIQARPIPRPEKLAINIEFPTDIEPLIECRAIGVGDVIVTLRNLSSYQEDEVPLDWVDTENEMGRTLGRRKTNSVVVIGHNDGRSGHIQMLAKENGQICLYPEPLKRLNGLDDYVYYNPRMSDRVRRLRVVADGYKGAIYPVED